jgi:hypothetical protein
LDFIVQPSWTTVDATPGGCVRGLGDTNLDAKWRFYGADAWSIGVRAGFGLPTAQRGLGVPGGNVSPHAILVATADLTPFAFDANLGYSYVPGDARQRPDQYHFSAAATYAANERLFMVLDAAADSNPDSAPASYQAVALLGVIYTVRPGLDVDVGYRGRIGGVAPVHQWLPGITFRGAKLKNHIEAVYRYHRKD